jgi:hypothetical protein
MPEKLTSLLESLPIAGRDGFACKVWVAAQLEKQYLGGVYYVWFSKELNPIGNGDSSNPLLLYADIDRAMKKRDLNHSKLKDLKARLLDVIARRVKPNDPHLAKSLRREVLIAPIEAFRPQLWKVNLSRIAASRVKNDRSSEGWDEQYVPDLAEGEFEIIVD